MLTDLDKEYIAYRCGAFLQAIDDRLDRLERILKAAAPPEPTPITKGRPITAVCLTNTMRHVLESANINYLEELTEWTPKMLLRLYKCGPGMVHDIENSLKELGLSLKKDSRG